MLTNARGFSPLLLVPFLIIACTDSPSDSGGCSVSSVTITGAPATLSVGGTAQLAADVVSTDCSSTPTVSWSTSSGTTAMVNNSGLVSALVAGPVTITATAGGKSGTALITIVNTPAASVRIAPQEVVIGAGQTFTMLAEALDAEGDPIPGKTFTWQTDNGTNVGVSGAGVVTGGTANSTAIISAAVDGVSGVAQVRVVRRRLAFFWNDFPTPVGTQPATTGYEYSSLGSIPTVSSSGVGIYNAEFPDQGRLAYEAEALFVSPYSMVLGGYCRQTGWTQTTLGVACHDQDGDPVSARWTVAHISGASLSGRWGFAWIPSGTESTPASTSYSFNPTGGSITSTRNGAGDYTVRFAGLGRRTANDREAVIVNAYGDNATCQPASWSSFSGDDPFGPDLYVEVRCFKPNSSAVDSRFTVLVVDGERPGARLAFVHADEPLTATYTPANGAVRPTGHVTVARTGIGEYTVSFTGFFRSGDLRETFLVSATASTPGRCQIDQWSYGSSQAQPAEVKVQCAHTNGVAADLPFSLVGLQ